MLNSMLAAYFFKSMEILLKIGFIKINEKVP